MAKYTPKPDRRVLVVEDDGLYAELLKRVLEHSGFEVDVAPCLRDATWKAVGRKFDAITLDLNLPDAVGFDALTRMRGISSDTPILVISGHITELDHLKMLAIGADSCMEKPPDVNVLPLAINRICRMRDPHCRIRELQRFEQSLLRHA